MTTYKIFSHPGGQTEAIKQGWSWPAFFFGWLWAFVKGMWALGFGLLIGSFVVGAFLGFVTADGAAAEGFIILISFIVSVIFGAQGNEWRGNHVQSKGYELHTVTQADNPQAAIALSLREA